MVDMKRLLSLICGIIILGVVAIGGACANPPELSETEALGIQDLRVIDFIQNCVINNEDRFVYDEEHRAALTEKFDTENRVYQRQTFDQAKVLHANEVNRLLSEGKDVKYDDNVLSDWAFCELRKRGVECERLSVGWCDYLGDPIPSTGRLMGYCSVLIPQVVEGSKKWYVCDVSEMSHIKNAGQSWYKTFLFCPLKDYLELFGDGFKGAVVNDREYIRYCYDVGAIGGRDIFCWLSEDGHSASFAVDMLASNPSFGSRFMSSTSHYEKDLWRFNFLRRLAYLRTYPVHEIVLT